ncbi:MAG: chromate transporter [Actinomycetota bacterium]|nr:chromate transporter [Actinomycetota bacterium]
MSDLLQLAIFFAGISLLAVGGGNATLPAIQQHAIQAGWVDSEGFLQIYALGQIAPGPSTMYVAGIGYNVAGVPGGLVAGLAFVIPSSILVVVAGMAWARWKPSPVKTAVKTGLAPITVALLTVGAWNLVTALGTLSDGTRQTEAVAFATIIGIAALISILAQFTKVSPALLVLGGGIAGFIILA